MILQGNEAVASAGHVDRIATGFDGVKNDSSARIGDLLQPDVVTLVRALDHAQLDFGVCDGLIEFVDHLQFDGRRRDPGRRVKRGQRRQDRRDRCQP